MPNSYIFEGSDGLLGPRIIPASGADKEEARIRRLMDLAKLRSLEVAPEQEERLFRQRQQEFQTQTDLARQGLEQTKAIQLRGQDIDMRGQDINTRGQDLQYSAQTRGQDIGLKESQERNKAQIVENLVRAAADPRTNLPVLAEYAKTIGEPGLATSIEAVEGKELDLEVQKFLPALTAAKQTNDTKGYLTGLENAKAKGPKFIERLKASAPEYAVDLDPTKPISLATDPQLREVEAKAVARKSAAAEEKTRLRKLSETFIRRKRAGLEPNSFDPTTPFIIPGYIR